MLKEGVMFYAPINTVDNGVQKFRNFNRTDDNLTGDSTIRFDDLNKSDYLYQTIILLILRKIDIKKNNDSERLYKLINDIEKLLDDIFTYEISGDDNRDIELSYILEESRAVAYRCISEEIFDYE